jgi:hypothetical protein
MHCVAGDGVGILAGAVIASLFHLPKSADIALEYALGFGFGWSIFQSLFMRGMAGGSYTHVDYHIQQRQCGEKKPQKHYAIEHFDLPVLLCLEPVMKFMRVV